MSENTPVTFWPEEPIVRHGPNGAGGRDLVIGDLHGHFDTLERALEELAFDASRDRLFSVGDLIDCGPRSEDTIEWLEQKRIASVRGNHEQMMVKALVCDRGWRRKSGPTTQWTYNGGNWWFGEWRSNFDTHEALEQAVREQCERWLAALRRVPFARSIQTSEGTIGIVHTLELHTDWDQLCEGLNRNAEDVRTEFVAAVNPSRLPNWILSLRPEVERTTRDAPDLPDAITGVDRCSSDTHRTRPRGGHDETCCASTPGCISTSAHT